MHAEPDETDPGVLRVEGWVISERDDTIYQVRVVAQGKTKRAVYPIPRPDVAATFPAARHAATSGFAVTLAMEPGAVFKLVLEAKLATAGWQPFHKKKITVPGAPTRIGRIRNWLGERKAARQKWQHPSLGSGSMSRLIGQNSCFGKLERSAIASREPN